MKILALDSSTSTASIAFLDDHNNILFDYHQPQQRTDSSVFFEGLQMAFQQCGKPDRLVVGLGPGSYNGLRSSIAAAQGIAAATHIELVGLSSIFGVEMNCENKGCWVMGDARGGQYWLAAIQDHELLEEPFLLAPADIPHHVKRRPDFSFIASQQLPQLPASMDVVIQTPRATILARQGKEARPSIILEPFYLKQAHITMPRAL